MIKLDFVAIKEFLNKKYFDLISQEQRRITIQEFAALFGASKSLMTMWMSGDRSPGPEYKERIIERYGDEAILAFGENPDLYAVQKNWEYFTPEERRQLRARAEEKAQKNVERTSKKRRISTTE